MAATADGSSSLKRSVADVDINTMPAFGGGAGDGGAATAKRPRTIVPAAALTAEVAALVAAVASGKAREAVQAQRIAELEVDNARLSIENATLRKRPRLVPRPATLQQLVNTVGRHEPDLRDLLFALVCMPRHLARCAAELPANPAGVLGTFAVTVPIGTTMNYRGRGGESGRL